LVNGCSIYAAVQNGLAGAVGKYSNYVIRTPKKLKKNTILMSDVYVFSSIFTR